MDWKSEVLKVYPDTEIVLIKRTGKYFATSKNGTNGVGGRLSEYCDTEAQTWESAYQRLPKRDGAEGGTPPDIFHHEDGCPVPHAACTCDPPDPSVVAESGPRKSQGLCDTTMTPRFENKNCVCPTYAGNLRPCAQPIQGANGRCVYCDHLSECHFVGAQADTAAVAECPKCHEEHTGDCDPRDSPERIAELVAMAEREKGELEPHGKVDIVNAYLGDLLQHFGDVGDAWDKNDVKFQETLLSQLYDAAVADSMRSVAPPPPVEGQKDGVALIAAERARQIAVEGWTPEHDDEHIMGEMIGAAITYCGHTLTEVSDNEIDADGLEFWPWDENWWKPSLDPIRNLVKAGALLAAEIDRLQRSKP